MSVKALKLFKSGSSLVVAFDRKDARKVMLEEWGEICPITQIHNEVPVSDDGENVFKMSPTAAAVMWGRGIAPQL